MDSSINNIHEEMVIKDRFQLFFNHSPIPTAVTRIKDGRYELVNESFLEVMGYTEEEVIGKTSQELNIFADAKDRSTGIDLVMEKGHFEDIEFRLTKKNGELITFLISAKTLNYRDDVYLILSAKDITERQQMMEALKKSEEKYRILFENSTEMILVFRRGKIILCNAMAEAVTGYNRQELQSKYAFDLIYTEDRDRIMKNHERRLNGEKFGDTNVFRIVKKDGALRWVEMHSVRIDWESEAATLNFIIDITDKKLSEEENTMVIQTTTDAFWLNDLEGRFLQVNDALCKMMGYSREELLNMSISDLTYNRTGEAVFEKRVNSIKTSGSALFEAQYKRKNGDVMYAEVSVTYLPLSNRLCNFLRDITERKLAEEEYTAVVQNTMDAFWLTDMEGNLLKVNDALCSLTEYSREELLNMNITDITPDQSKEDVLNRIDMIKGAGSKRFEAKHLRKGGFVFDAEISATYLSSSNRICVFLHDITERKKREQEIAYLSFHDTLTGLFNRAYFEEACGRLDALNQVPVSIIMGDVNGLKLTNDVFGHRNGDKLLCSVAEIMNMCTRKGDIAARIGGDEFCILLPGTDEAAARKVCERIYTACEGTSLKIDGSIYHPSVSLGFATKLGYEQSINELLRIAENSMYKRKLLESKSMHSSLISNIRTTMFEKSHETNEHAERLASLAKKVGTALKLPYDQMSDLELLSTLHDIGKIGVADHILCKPGPLDEQEWTEIKKHPEIGYRIALASAELIPAAEGILCHHERWDGKGYPQGLAGEKIPLLARIISVVDTFDAMTHERVYRLAMSLEEAKQEIQANSGKQFDPIVVQAFLDIVQDDDI